MNAVTTTNNQLPDFLKGQKKTATVGNLDRSDMIVPRVKLLQAISPEVTENDGAKQGEFWHTVASVSLGKTLRAVPIIIRKSYALWSPRNDDRGILARASDGVHWDNWQDENGNPKTFTVKPKGAVREITYTLAATVAESGLAEFGSSIPGLENSPPAAALTYDMLFHLVDFPELSPAVVINTRSSVKKAKMLISKIDTSPVDHYAQVYLINIRQEQGDEGPYYNYEYQGDGFVQDKDMFEYTKGLYDAWADREWKASDESTTEDDVANNTGAAAKPAVAEKDRKF